MKHQFWLQFGAACVACVFGLAGLAMFLTYPPSIIVIWVGTAAWCVGTVRGPLGALGVSALLFGFQSVAILLIGFWLSLGEEGPDLTPSFWREMSTMMAGGWIVSGVVASVVTKWVAIVPLRRLLRRLFPPEGVCACGYPTRGLPGPRCPECGRELRRREQP
jgi:xanthine/uracil permease